MASKVLGRQHIHTILLKQEYCNWGTFTKFLVAFTTGMHSDEPPWQNLHSTPLPCPTLSFMAQVEPNRLSNPTLLQCSLTVNSYDY